MEKVKWERDRAKFCPILFYHSERRGEVQMSVKAVFTSIVWVIAVVLVITLLATISTIAFLLENNLI